MPEQEMTTEQDRSGMSREQLESALAQREDQLRRSQAKLEVMQGAEPILLSEIREYKSALKDAKVALESALAGVWDGHYSGKGVVVEYAQAVDKEVKSALATINKVLE